MTDDSSENFDGNDSLESEDDDAVAVDVLVQNKIASIARADKKDSLPW